MGFRCCTTKARSVLVASVKVILTAVGVNSGVILAAAMRPGVDIPGKYYGERPILKNAIQF